MSEPPLLDVRPEIAAGGEPLGTILEVAEAVPAGGSFVLLAPFEPVPLLGLLARRGFDSEVTPLGDGGCRVVFTRRG